MKIYFYLENILLILTIILLDANVPKAPFSNMQLNLEELLPLFGNKYPRISLKSKFIIDPTLNYVNRWTHTNFSTFHAIQILTVIVKKLM
jgi:hypothetical protein